MSRHSLNVWGDIERRMRPAQTATAHVPVRKLFRREQRLRGRRCSRPRLLDVRASAVRLSQLSGSALGKRERCRANVDS